MHVPEIPALPTAPRRPLRYRRWRLRRRADAPRPGWIPPAGNSGWAVPSSAQLQPPEGQEEEAESDAVPGERHEAVLADEPEEDLDHHQRREKGRDEPDREYGYVLRTKERALLEKLVEGGRNHDRD